MAGQDDLNRIDADVKELEQLQRILHNSNEAFNEPCEAAGVRCLGARMNFYLNLTINKAKLIENLLKALDANHGCGSRTYTDRVLIHKNLKKLKEAFAVLQVLITSDYRRAVRRLYYAMNGERPDSLTLEALVAARDREQFVSLAIRGERQDELVEIMAELQERHEAAKEMEPKLRELQQVLHAVVVEEKEDVSDKIENNVKGADSVVIEGGGDVLPARWYQKNTCQRICLCFALFFVIVLIAFLGLLFPLVLRNKF